MTYNTFEVSIDDGSPMEIYLFTKPGGGSWSYCSGDLDVTYLGRLYASTVIERDSVEITGTTSEKPLGITVPRDNEFAVQYIAHVPTSEVSLEIYRFHRGDIFGPLNTITEVELMWRGTVKSVEWKGSSALVNCGLFTSALQRQGPTKLFQRLCPHMLYDAQCAVLESNHTVSGVITIPDLNNTRIFTMAEAAAGGTVYKGGYALRGLDEYRTIEDHAGNTITLVSAFEGLQTGETLQVFAGCDKAISTCNVTFSNVEQYGGFPFIPIKNPFVVGLED